VIVVPTYRGYRIEVNAQAVDGRYNAGTTPSRTDGALRP